MIKYFNELSKTRKIFILSLIGTVVLLAIILLLSTILKPGNKSPNANRPIQIFSPAPKKNQLPNTNLSTNTELKLTAITSIPRQTNPSAQASHGNSVLFPSLLDNYIYYLSDNGTTFFKISLDGKDKQRVSDYLSSDIQSTTWSPDKKSVIMSVTNNTLRKDNPFYSPNDPDLVPINWYYDLNNKSQKQLSTNIVSPIFLPNTGRLVYLKTENNGVRNKLYSSNVDGTDENLILSYPELNQDVLVYAGNNQIISWANPEGFGKNYLYRVNLIDKTVEVISNSGLDFRAKTSPLGDQIITQTVDISKSPNYKFFLSLINLNTKSYTQLGVEADIKLSNWSGDGSFIYALTDNGLWIIDAKSFSKSLLPFPSTYQGLKPDVENGILVAPDNHAVFFTSDDLLYELTF